LFSGMWQLGRHLLFYIPGKVGTVWQTHLGSVNIHTHRHAHTHTHTHTHTQAHTYTHSHSQTHNTYTEDTWLPMHHERLLASIRVAHPISQLQPHGSNNSPMGKPPSPISPARMPSAFATSRSGSGHSSSSSGSSFRACYSPYSPRSPASALQQQRHQQQQQYYQQQQQHVPQDFSLSKHVGETVCCLFDDDDDEDV